jgi:23S rRNA (uracil1939-C5)-methyltransferase
VAFVDLDRRFASKSTLDRYFSTNVYLDPAPESPPNCAPFGPVARLGAVDLAADGRSTSTFASHFMVNVEVDGMRADRPPGAGRAGPSTLGHMTSPPASTRPARGAEVELTVDALAHGGNGVARLDGYVVFVAGAVPGDRVRAEVTKSKRAYAEARATEILSPSPDRIPARADHPGAPWQVLPYERQLTVKAEQVGDALRRIGKLDRFEQEPIVPAVEQWRYRNKLEYSFGTDDEGTLVCGFHAPGRFDRILPLEDCLLASERGDVAREQVLGWARARGLEAWDRRTQAGFLRNLVVREGRRTGELQVRLVTGPGELDTRSLTAAVDATGLFWTQMTAGGESTTGGETRRLAGAARLREQLGELEFLISPDAFFQTNTEMAERLYSTAVEFAGLRGTERVFDLYCGIGTIALALAARARAVVGVEIVEPAVADAIANARRNEITNASFYAGDIRLALRELVEREGRPDVLVVDPPRAGLSQKIVRRIAEAGPRRIVYVSCNPTTLAPNAAQLTEAGYRLLRVRPVDMFPQTPHIECVALLERA